MTPLPPVPFVALIGRTPKRAGQVVVIHVRHFGGAAPRGDLRKWETAPNRQIPVYGHEYGIVELLAS